MRVRTWGIVISVNIIVSAAVMLAVLFVWDRTLTSETDSPQPLSGLPATETTTSPVGASVFSPTLASGERGIASPEPQVYIVQPGDTLGAIAEFHGVSIEDLITANSLADPDVLHLGQTLIIPAGDSVPTPEGSSSEGVEEPSETPEPLTTALPTPTSSGPPLIEIAQVLGSGDLAAEIAVVRNRGGATSLENWMLSDAEGNTFVFPAITLFADAEVRIHTAPGNNTPTDLYWRQVSPVWSGGELITLRDAAGNPVDTYIVP
jgi:LysM repeat protein